MPVPGTHNISIVRGEDFSLSFTVTIEGVILDLTGATAYAQIREIEARSGNLLADFTTAISNDPDNVVTITLTDSETAGIPEDQAWYDVVIRDDGGNDTYYLKGRVTIEGSVTVVA
jgi:hypothetical protein